MLHLVRRNFILVLQRQSDVVQAVQQTVSYKFIDRESGAESLIVAHLALFEVDRYFVVIDLLRPPHHSRSLILTQLYRHKSVLR